jgi:hypothetical protein
MKLPTRQLITIVVTSGLLIAILVMKQQCGNATAKLFESVSQVPDASHD